MKKKKSKLLEKVFKHDIMEKKYNPKDVEKRIYRFWEETGYFNPDNLSGENSFSIVLPPPNVTGNLHMGHAAMIAYQDIMIRVSRMKGEKALWIPGTDHASIATSSKVEKIIYKKEKKTRHDLGREEFLKRVEEFAQSSHDTIVGQIKSLGASLDWSREAYTLDEKRNIAVNTAFKKMFDEGLIYRGERIVNWDPLMGTTVSDDEIEREEKKTPFYYFKFGPFTIATSRPETKLGDRYIVMHPKDKRYLRYKHKEEIDVEWINGKITATIIKDEAVDPEFGTGAMTITPWHDLTDFEIAERHSLEKKQIIDFDGKLLDIAGEFSGMHIKKARPLIVEKFKEKGLLVDVDENYTNSIAVNSRGGGVIESQIKKQWFVDVKKQFVLTKSEIDGIESGEKVSLKELMRKPIETGQIRIFPDRFKKIYYHWIDNLRDWCISRQIWYGHRIPVWYKGGEVYCGIEPPKEKEWKQDEDTLDTWFSSSLWTFSTLGWPEKTKDFELYHPTSVMETGYDILFFWVARMILMTTYILGEVPFKNIYLHGLVLDEKGKKMSKSVGNTIDPLDMIEKYGADATRISLIVGATAGTDIRLSENKIKGYRNFTNKLWNIARFVLMKTEKLDLENEPQLSKRDKEIMDEFYEIAKKVNRELEEYRFSHSAETLYHYIWHNFADNIIEESKDILEDKEKCEGRGFVLLRVLSESIKLLHPFMPYVTEEIYQILPIKEKKETIMIEEWPV